MIWTPLEENGQEGSLLTTTVQLGRYKDGDEYQDAIEKKGFLVHRDLGVKLHYPYSNAQDHGFRVSPVLADLRLVCVPTPVMGFDYIPTNAEIRRWGVDRGFRDCPPEAALALREQDEQQVPEDFYIVVSEPVKRPSHHSEAPSERNRDFFFLFVVERGNMDDSNAFWLCSYPSSDDFKEGYMEVWLKRKLIWCLPDQV